MMATPTLISAGKVRLEMVRPGVWNSWGMLREVGRSRYNTYLEPAPATRGGTWSAMGTWRTRKMALRAYELLEEGNHLWLDRCCIEDTLWPGKLVDAAKALQDIKDHSSFIAEAQSESAASVQAFHAPS